MIMKIYSTFDLDSTDDENFLLSDWIIQLEFLFDKDYSSCSEEEKDKFFFSFFNIISRISKWVLHGKFGLGSVRNVLLSIIYKIKSMPSFPIMIKILKLLVNLNQKLIRYIFYILLLLLLLLLLFS